MTAVEKTDVIEAELKTCGYFAIITSEEMDAVTAYRIYKSRDASGKILLEVTRAFLGMRRYGWHRQDPHHPRFLFEFLALTVRSKIYSLLKDQKDKNGDDPNFMTVLVRLPS